MLEFEAGAAARLVRQALTRYGVPHEALDDAVQDVFVVLARRAHEFDRTRPLAGWLWGLARKVASTHRRSLRRRSRLARAFAQHDAAAVRTPEQEVALVRAAAFLDEFIAELGTTHRETFVLSEIHGLSGPEIASRLGINLNTTYARIRAVRRRFETALAAHHRFTVFAWLGRLFPAKPALLGPWIVVALIGALSGGHAPLRSVQPRLQPVSPSASSVAASASSPSRDRDEPAKSPDMTHALLTAWLLAPTPTASTPPKEPPPARQQEIANDEDADEAARVGQMGSTRHLIYDDDRLTGEVLAPDGKMILWRTRPRMESLLRIRPHFVRELVTLGQNL